MQTKSDLFIRLPSNETLANGTYGRRSIGSHHKPPSSIPGTQIMELNIGSIKQFPFGSSSLLGKSPIYPLSQKLDEVRVLHLVLLTRSNTPWAGGPVDLPPMVGS